MLVSSFIKNLTQIAEAVDPGYERAETFVLWNLLIYPVRTVNSDMLNPNRLQSVVDFRLQVPREACVRHEDIRIAYAFVNKLPRFVEFVGKVRFR